MPKPKAKRAKPKIPSVSLIDYLTPEDYEPYRDKLSCMRVGEASADPCPHCPGHCCKLLLSLTVHDIARICVALTIMPDEFCHLEPRDEQWTSPEVDIEGQPHQVFLNSGGLIGRGATKACVFLHTMTSQARCAIYTVRPMTCRLYPFQWHQGDQLSGPKIYWCPTQWVVDNAARRRITRTSRQSLVEDAENKTAIAAFNRQRKHPHTVEGFFRFAVEKGSELLDLDPSTVLNPPQPKRLGQRLW